MDVNYIQLHHKDITYYLCRMSGNDLSRISYVARRGESEEEGAVQRILSKNRISSIADYLLNGGYFPTNIILNVVDASKIEVDENASVLRFSEEAHIAQLLDGQHRVAGMREAIKADPAIGEIEFPVLVAVGLSTSQCATVFISINTEQKNVPKSLIYDLYGLVETPNRDYSLDRGRDIADNLNRISESPYAGYVKFPGTARFKGGIQLSSMVNSLRSLVKPQGEFEKFQITTLERQTKILLNYFRALQYYYDKKWYELTNPFIYASGFSAAIDVLINKLLPYCYSKKKFTVETFRSVIHLPKDKLPQQADVKGASGETAKSILYQKLSEAVDIEKIDEEDMEF